MTSLYTITDFMAHFRLTDEGIVELEGFGERFGDHVRERVHPVLGEPEVSPYDAAPEDRDRIKTAVQLERDRLKAEPATEPDTELGKRVKAQTDLPTSVINRHIHTSAREVLRKTKPKGAMRSCATSGPVHWTSLPLGNRTGCRDTSSFHAQIYGERWGRSEFRVVGGVVGKRKMGRQPCCGCAALVQVQGQSVRSWPESLAGLGFQAS